MLRMGGMSRRKLHIMYFYYHIVVNSILTPELRYGGVYERNLL